MTTLNPIPSIECSQAREAASARLDAELSELDAARLEAHLHECSDCREFAQGLAAFTGTLRDAPLERPDIPAFASRRRRVPGLTAAAAVALVAAAAVSSFALGRALSTAGSTVATTASSPVLGLQADSTRQHLLAMQSRVAAIGPAHRGRLMTI